MLNEGERTVTAVRSGPLIHPGMSASIPVGMPRALTVDSITRWVATGCWRLISCAPRLPSYPIGGSAKWQQRRSSRNTPCRWSRAMSPRLRFLPRLTRSICAIASIPGPMILSWLGFRVPIFGSLRSSSIGGRGWSTSSRSFAMGNGGDSMTHTTRDWPGVRWGTARCARDRATPHRIGPPFKLRLIWTAGGARRAQSGARP